MASIYDWSLTAASNATADSDLTWAEGQAPSTVNNSARVMMERIAELLGDIGGALAAGGTANAITVTANSSFTTYADGRLIAFKAASDNTGAVTLNVNSVGAKAIRRMGSSGDEALGSGVIQADGIYVLRYNSSLNSGAGAWQILNPVLDALFAPTAGSSSVTTVGALNSGSITSGFGSINIGSDSLTAGAAFLGAGVSTGDAKIELGSDRTGNGFAYIDFHGQPSTDYDARIVRNGGANGVFNILNNGTGGVSTNGTFTASGNLGVGTTDFTTDLSYAAKLVIEGSGPALIFRETDANPDWAIADLSGLLSIRDMTNTRSVMTFNNNGYVEVSGDGAGNFIFANSGAGNFILRPVGISGGNANDMTLSSSGNVTINGTLTVTG